MKDKNIDQNLKKKIARLIDKYDGEQLWYEAVKLAITTNPTIAQESLAVIREIKQERASLRDPKYGESEGKTMRAGIRMPVSLDSVLQIVDPEHFPINKLPLNEQKRIMKKMFKTFPEFTLAERF